MMNFLKLHTRCNQRPNQEQVISTHFLVLPSGTKPKGTIFLTLFQFLMLYLVHVLF